jgi:sugar phosphate isomerase/epimerase
MNFWRFCCQVDPAVLARVYIRAIIHPRGSTEMTIVSLVTIHPNQGVGWDDLQKQLKKACDLARKHGAENVTVLATMIGGEATNTIGLLSTAEDWGRFGQVQQSMMGDSEMQAAMQEAGRIATWETYVSQTIPDI